MTVGSSKASRLALCAFVALALVSGLFGVGGPAQAAQTPGTNAAQYFDTAGGAGLIAFNQADGSARTFLTGGLAADTAVEASPTGAFIVFQTGVGGLPGTGAIIRANNDGTARTTIVSTGAANPAVSPDGSTIVYECAAGAGGPGVCTSSASALGAPTLVTGTAAGDTDPDFAPNGTTLVFDRAAGVSTVPAAGGSVSTLPGTAGGDHARVNPAGTTVVYDVAAGLSTTPFPGGGVVTALTGAAAGSNDPVYSPDGTAVLFNSGGEASAAGFLTRLPAGGGGPTVVNGFAGDIDPAWSKSTGGVTPPPPPPPPTPHALTASCPANVAVAFGIISNLVIPPAPVTYAVTGSDSIATHVINLATSRGTVSPNTGTGTVNATVSYTPTVVDAINDVLDDVPLIGGLFSFPPSVLTVTDTGVPAAPLVTCSSNLNYNIGL